MKAGKGKSDFSVVMKKSSHPYPAFYRFDEVKIILNITY
jgi:hypothetical protein